jgi:hypothetical protein
MAPAQNRLDQIRDLVNQWEQLVGFSVTVPDWMVYEMSNQQTSAGFVTSMFGVGQYMLAHTAPGTYNLNWQDAPFQPWAWYGMSATEYNSKVDAFNNAYLQLTGQPLPANTGQGDLVDQALRQFQGSMSGPQFSTWLLGQDKIKDTFGWLKHGLDFQQFQQQKLTMNNSLGRTLSDAEAVTQLQFMHAAQGPNVSAASQQTLTQQEKKTAQVGVGQSEVR